MTVQTHHQAPADPAAASTTTVVDAAAFALFTLTAAALWWLVELRPIVLRARVRWILRHTWRS